MWDDAEFRGHRGRERGPRFHEDQFDDGYHERRDAQRRKFLEERRRGRGPDSTLARPLINPDMVPIEDPTHFPLPPSEFNNIPPVPVVKTVVPAETIFDLPGRAERPSHVSNLLAISSYLVSLLVQPSHKVKKTDTCN